jgi:hypothetical protein
MPGVTNRYIKMPAISMSADVCRVATAWAGDLPRAQCLL